MSGPKPVEAILEWFHTHRWRIAFIGLVGAQFVAGVQVVQENRELEIANATLTERVEGGIRPPPIRRTPVF